jgi:hypothetical protein
MIYFQGTFVSGTSALDSAPISMLYAMRGMGSCRFAMHSVNFFFIFSNVTQKHESVCSRGYLIWRAFRRSRRIDSATSISPMSPSTASPTTLSMRSSDALRSLSETNEVNAKQRKNLTAIHLILILRVSQKARVIVFYDMLKLRFPGQSCGV